MMNFSNPLPQTLQVGWRTYTITPVDLLQDEDGTRLNGHIKYSEEIIYIDSSLPLKFQWASLIHELLHAVAYANGDRLGEEDIHGLAEGIMSVLYRNAPELDSL